MGSVYLMAPKVRSGGYIPFFVTERKRSEEAQIHVVQKACVLAGVSWAGRKRCKVHFMRNILAPIPQKGENAVAKELKEIWLAPAASGTRERAAALCAKHAARYSKAIETPENGLEDSLTFHGFP